MITRSIWLRVKQQSLDRTETTVHKHLSFETRKEASGDWEGLEFKAANDASSRLLELVKKEVNKFIVKWQTEIPAEFSKGVRVDYRLTTKHVMSDGTSAYLETHAEVQGSTTFNRAIDFDSDTEVAVLLVYDTTLYEIGLTRDGAARVMPQIGDDNSVRDIVLELGGVLEWFHRSYAERPGRESLDRAFTYLLEAYDEIERCMYCDAVHRHGEYLYGGSSDNALRELWSEVEVEGKAEAMFSNTM